MATSNNTVVVSRIQNRRGLKQDLPQPLRSGEIGLSTDSRQVFIGGGEIDSTENKVLIFENTDNARQIVDSIAKNQIISFTVPHRRYNTSLDGLNGTAKAFTYTGGSDVSDTNSSRDVFRSSVGAGNLVSIETGSAFDADDLSVVKNGIALIGNNIASIGNLTTEDYIFSSGTSLGNDHTITFKSIPLTSDDIGITYYGNSAISRVLSGAPSGDANIKPGYSALTNFYARDSVPTFLQIPEDLIIVNSTTGSGYIGFQHKHIAVTALSTSDVSTLTFTNFLVSKDSELIDNITFAESSDTFTVPYAHANQKYVPTSTANNFNRVHISNCSVSAVNGVHNITAANATHFQFAISGYSGATSGTLAHTRVLQYDISGAPSSGDITTSLNTISGIINNRGNITTGSNVTQSWGSLNVTPEFDSATGSALASKQVYFTHKSTQNSNPADFTLHESGSTLTNLKLTPQNYNRSTNTIRAQLEQFLVEAMENVNLNVFNNIQVNQRYKANSTLDAKINSYNLNTNTEGTEITFDTNEEARNFSTLVNNLYFEYSIYNTPGAGGLGSLTVNSRGLTNIKNNIQLQTAEGASSGLPDVGYDSTETASVPAEANTNIKTFDMTAFDTFVIDYSLDFRNGADLYRKVGLLQLSSYDYGSGNPADVVIQDYGTDKALGSVTGNVQFTANVASSVLTLTAISSVNQSCAMKYIVRKWNAPST